jgi:cytochrome c
MSRSLRIGVVAAVCMTGAAFALNAAAQDPVAQAGDAEAGGEIYSTECRGCHAVSIAPTLRGVIGRPIASVADFAGYSDGLKAKASGTWTEANLDAFLKAPGEFAPGTLMTKSIDNPQVRADIIAYIATLPPPRS